MISAADERLVRALLYEGALLYPYRADSLKNQFRWTSGTLYPEAFAAGSGERSALRLECLVLGERARVDIGLRFLRLLPRKLESGALWHEPVECAEQLRVELDAAVLSMERRMMFPSDDPAAPICATVCVDAQRVDDHAFRLTVRVHNHTEMQSGCVERDAALLRALVSAHLLLESDPTGFVSMLDPPAQLRASAAQCESEGVWPVLLGEPENPRVLLGSPIILYDHPAIAPESPGDLYDATEIDEMLTLRVRTLAASEKSQVKALGGQAAALLSRCEALDVAALSALHGTQRTVTRAAPPKASTKVRLRPKPGRDVFDLSLAGELATVVGVEQEVGGRVYCLVTIDRDPGRDLGARGFPGHRFFFELDELEVLEP